MRATDVEHSTITECSDSSSFSLSKQPGNVFEIALVLSFYWFSSSAWLMLSILIIALHLCFYWFLELAPWLCFASVYALYINMIFTFTRDVRQPLPQIRLSLCVSLDRSWTNHLSLWNKRHRKNGEWLYIIGGIPSKTSFLNETWNQEKMNFLVFPLLSFADSVYHISSSYAVFPDGRFLLDAGRGNLSLPSCCESL